MAYSRGRCLLTPILIDLNMSQAELSRRTGYSPDQDANKGYSPRMISHFAQFDGQGKGKPMSPEAMYTISRALGISMSALYEWIEQ